MSEPTLSIAVIALFIAVTSLWSTVPLDQRNGLTTNAPPAHVCECRCELEWTSRLSFYIVVGGAVFIFILGLTVGWCCFRPAFRVGKGGQRGTLQLGNY